MRNVLFLKSAVVFNPSSIVHSYYGKLILQNIYNDCGIINFPDNNNSSSSFKSNKKKPAETGIGGTEAVKTMVTLKYYSNFWRALEMSLISCENNLICYRCKPRKIIRND